jgi:hypothetical protein
MNTLPNADNAFIPHDKLTKYSLDFEKDFNKADAFKKILGYNKGNYIKLIQNVYENIRNFEAVFKGYNGYGDLYEVVMNLTGENGKNANVLTGWIIENGMDAPRLTNIYVTKKKIKGVNAYDT